MATTWLLCHFVHFPCLLPALKKISKGKRQKAKFSNKLPDDFKSHWLEPDKIIPLALKKLVIF
jgi:hypothetical protein